MALKAIRQIYTMAEIRSTVRAFKCELDSDMVPWKKIILFGSYVFGTPHRDSDIDVAVIVSARMSEETRSKLLDISRYAKQVDTKLEVHVLTTKELQNKWLSISEQIRTHGKVLYAKS